MLFAGTFTGFVEGFVKARGVVNFSLWAKRVSGVVVALVGGLVFVAGNLTPRGGRNFIIEQFEV